MQNSYQTAASRYKDLQESTYNQGSEAFKQLNRKQTAEEMKKAQDKKLAEVFTTVPSNTTFGTLPEVNWDEIEEGANSKEYLAKELHNFYIDKCVFMGNKRNRYNLYKNEFLEDYNIQLLGPRVEKIENILGKVLENGIITLHDGVGPGFEVSKFIGVETVGENIRNADTVIGLYKEVNLQAPETNDFNHHPVFVFEDQNGKERKITYHALLGMKVD